MSPELAGRVALVTGSARGLGFAIARRLGQDGYLPLICDLEPQACDHAVAALEAEGIVAEAMPVDVSSELAVSALYVEVESRYGRLDALVNNAGVLGLLDGKKPRLEELSLALWQQTLDVNLTGTFLMTRAAAPLMRRGGWGRIVNICSRAARMRTGIGNSNYAASKAAIIGFSRVVAGELGPDGITVNCIAPSRIDTAMTRDFTDSSKLFASNAAETAVGRIGSGEDVAAAAAYLCSSGAAFVTGVVLDVNGGSFMA
jgi:NAD(P)-dependent dehydrogenase (short-subunit alcohol dehydrogenase family)